MNIDYDNDDNFLKITHVERVKNKNITHRYMGTPLVVQRHPLNNDIIRVYLEGSRPNWLDRVNISNDSFSFGNGTLGWWIANWKVDSNIITTPSIEGALYMIIERIPDEFSELKKRLRDNIEIAKMNITYNQSHYNDLGLYYKPEEINGIAGALYLNNYNAFTKKRRDEDHAAFLQRFTDSDFPRLIEELTIPFDYSEEFLLSQEEQLAGEDNEWTEDEYKIPIATEKHKSEEVIDTTLEGEWEETETSVATEQQESEEVIDTTLEGEWEEAEHPVAIEQQESDTVIDAALEGEWEEVEHPVVIEQQESDTVIDAALEGEWEESETPEDTEQQVSEVSVDETLEVPELRVAESVNKRSDAMTGQLLLF